MDTSAEALNVFYVKKKALNIRYKRHMDQKLAGEPEILRRCI